MKYIKSLILLLLLCLAIPSARAQTYLPGQLDVGSITVTNMLGVVGAVLAPASGLTNYTLTATNSAVTINGTNAIRFTLLAGSTAGMKQFPTITNFSGSDITLAFTNTWKKLGTASGFLTNAKTATIRFEVEGANVRYRVDEEL